MQKTFNVTYYDVLRDTEGGWNFNGAVVVRKELYMLEEASERACDMQARAMFGFTGRRTIREDFGDVVRWIDPKSAVAVEVDYSTLCAPQ